MLVFTQIIHAFSYPKWGGLLLVLLVGVIWLVAGIALIARPIEGIVVLTLMVAAAFLAEGILKAIFAGNIISNIRNIVSNIAPKKGLLGPNFDKLWVGTGVTVTKNIQSPQPHPK